MATKKVKLMQQTVKKHIPMPVHSHLQMRPLPEMSSRRNFDRPFSEHASVEQIYIPPYNAEMAKNAPGMSTEWSTLPFALPKAAKNHKMINEILRFSMRQQKEDEISDNCGFVTLIIHRCLNAVDIENKIVSGFRKTETASTPHIWLEIQGYVIDNTYIKEFSKSSTDYLQSKTPGCYEECDVYTYEEIGHNPMKCMTGGPLDTVEMAGVFMKRRIQFYIHKANKALALNLNREQSYNFYFAMIRHMFDVYEVCIEGIDPRERYVCWWCGALPNVGKDMITDQVTVDSKEYSFVQTSNVSDWKFLHCGRCMVARYCSHSCQDEDWKENHRITCLSRGSVYLPPLGDIPFLTDSK